LSAWIKLKESSIDSEPETKETGHEGRIKNIGLDVHKNSISIGTADIGRDGEVRYYGTINNGMNQSDTVIRKRVCVHHTASTKTRPLDELTQREVFARNLNDDRNGRHNLDDHHDVHHPRDHRDFQNDHGDSGSLHQEPFLGTDVPKGRAHNKIYANNLRYSTTRSLQRRKARTQLQPVRLQARPVGRLE